MFSLLAQEDRQFLKKTVFFVLIKIVLKLPI